VVGEDRLEKAGGGGWLRVGAARARGAVVAASSVGGGARRANVAGLVGGGRPVDGGRFGRGPRGRGRLRCGFARACLGALRVGCSPVPASPVAWLARGPGASGGIGAARGGGGGRGRAVTNAGQMAWRGFGAGVGAGCGGVDPVQGADRGRASAVSPRWWRSARGGGLLAGWLRRAGVLGTGLSAARQRVAAIGQGQVRAGDRAWNPAVCCPAARTLSGAVSLASLAEPGTREQDNAGSRRCPPAGAAAAAGAPGCARPTRSGSAGGGLPSGPRRRCPLPGCGQRRRGHRKPGHPPCPVFPGAGHLPLRQAAGGEPAKRGDGGASIPVLAPCAPRGYPARSRIRAGGAGPVGTPGQQPRRRRGTA